MPRNDQVTRQWHLLRKLKGSRGATLQELTESLPDDIPADFRAIRRGLVQHFENALMNPFTLRRPVGPSRRGSRTWVFRRIRYHTHVPNHPRRGATGKASKITNCDLKARAAPEVPSVRFHRTWRHHGSQRVKQPAGRPDERVRRVVPRAVAGLLGLVYKGKGDSKR
jgi:hypothetical protein